MLADQYGKPLGVPENPITIGAKDSNGDPVTLTVDGDGLLKVVSSVTSVTATDITVHDPVNVANKLVVNADGTIGVSLSGSKLEEQLDQDDAITNVLTFSENITAIEIYHEETIWQSFMVNGIALKIPAGGYRTPVGGIAGATVTIPAGVNCLVGRLV